ncbi:putative nuclease HARBI1 [Rhinatrema bivittatum]|uniref:putative nuclease HARBI1 n=1 Tax=Rhinatrema bivittatum TaxID=194408 RepID=UPI00112ECBD8|nr:putative nuclease HARBI1 [Rhinatrema bivittatum]
MIDPGDQCTSVALRILLIMDEGRYRSRASRRRVFKPRLSLDELLQRESLSRFRLSIPIIRDLCTLLRPHLSPRIDTPYTLSVEVKVLAALRFLSTGSFQRVTGDTTGISQASVSRSLEKFLDGMMAHVDHFVHFPCAESEVRATHAGFFALGGFPKVLSIVDCTHVALIPPSTEEEVYRNRKQQHSMNMQVACDHQHVITNVFAKFPGSSHDAHILNQSPLAEYMRAEGSSDGWLLGDSAYTLETWLMTPFLHPREASQDAYNRAHRTTHRAMERTLALLKARFRALDNSKGALPFTPEKVCKIFTVCCMLHNLAIWNGLPLPEDTLLAEGNWESEQPIRHIGGINELAFRTRKQLVDQTFACASKFC